MIITEPASVCFSSSSPFAFSSAALPYFVFGSVPLPSFFSGSVVFPAHHFLSFGAYTSEDGINKLEELAWNGGLVIIVLIA